MLYYTCTLRKTLKDFDLSLRELFYDMIVAATSVLYLINTSATYRRGHVQFYFIGQQKHRFCTQSKTENQTK